MDGLKLQHEDYPMNKMFTQPTGPVAKENNKEAIARIFGLKKSQVGYLSTTTPIDSYVILFDKETQTCWYRGTATGTPVSWSVSGDVNTVTTTVGIFYLNYAGNRDLYPHENGVDTTGKTDAGAALTQLIYRAITENKAIRCRSSDRFLLNTPIEVPFQNARYSKAGFDRWFFAEGSRFYPGTAGMKMFKIARPQFHIENIRIINSAYSAVPDPLVKNVPGVTAFYYGSLDEQGSQTEDQYQYMGFMYCSIDTAAIGGVECAITLRPGASPKDSAGNYQSTGAYYCSFNKVFASECWYFCKQLESLTPDNTTNRHRFTDCQHQGGLCSFYAEPRAGGDCNITNFLAETINWQPRTTGTYTDPDSVTAPSVFWAFYDVAKTNGFGMMNTRLLNCNFEGNDVSVPNYFMPADGSVGIRCTNLMTPYRGSMLGKGTDITLYPTPYGNSEDTDNTIEGSLFLRNAKSGIASGNYSNAAFNSRLRFRMYDGLTQMQIVGYQNKTDAFSGGSSTWGIGVYDYTSGAQWSGYFGLPNKIRLDNTNFTDPSEVVFSTSIKMEDRNKLGFTYTPSATAGHVFTFDSVNTGVKININGAQNLLPGYNNQINLGYLGNTWKSGYFNAWTISDSGIIPTSNNAYDIGSSNYHPKNIYAENAVIVVSDGRLKPIQEPLSDVEILVAVECAQLTLKYKLQSDISEKGEENARFHIGVIAQELIGCFDRHGLDWRSYEIITHNVIPAKDSVVQSWDEEWKILPEVLDNEGNVVEEEKKVLLHAAGSIEIEPAQAANDIYMVRYDELNCFVNAGLIAKQKELEERIKKLEK